MIIIFVQKVIIIIKILIYTTSFSIYVMHPKLVYALKKLAYCVLEIYKVWKLCVPTGTHICYGDKGEEYN